MCEECWWALTDQKNKASWRLGTHGAVTSGNEKGATAANSRQRIHGSEFKRNQWAVPAADGWETCLVDAADLELRALPLGVHPHAELLGPVLPLCALVGRVRKLARQQREGLAGVGAVDCDELLPRSVGLLLGFRLRRVRCSFFV